MCKIRYVLTLSQVPSSSTLSPNGMYTAVCQGKSIRAPSITLQGMINPKPQPAGFSNIRKWASNCMVEANNSDQNLKPDEAVPQFWRVAKIGLAIGILQSNALMVHSSRCSYALRKPCLQTCEFTYEAWSEGSDLQP